MAAKTPMTAYKATHSLAPDEERFIESSLGMLHDAPGARVRHPREPSGEAIPADVRRESPQGQQPPGIARTEEDRDGRSACT